MRDFRETLVAYICSHGFRPAFECKGDGQCYEMTRDEILDYIKRQSQNDEDRIIYAFALGRRVGWATSTPR